MATKFETVRGMRDFLPEEKIKRDDIINKIKTVFEAYGFAPLETPVAENIELLKGKYGEEEKLVYEFDDKGGRKLGLRYDLTVPLARIVASNLQLSKPFKRYAIDKVWRYDRPGKGRYREFYQCDVDTIGVQSCLADAELLACANSALKAIGLKNFKFRINSRKLMNQLLKDAGVTGKDVVFALRIIDKLDKMGEEEIRKELKTRLSEESVNEVFGLINCRGNFGKVCKCFTIDSDIRKEITEFLKYLKSFGITNYVFDISLARGLDYYTGFIFEIEAGEEIGSIGGGGRYDNLISELSGTYVPATGISLGLERIMDLLKPKPQKTKTKVFVIPINALEEAIKIAEKLRVKGINTDISDIKISKALEYSSKQGIPYVIFVGEKELAKKKVKLKDMKTGKEQLLSVEQVIKKLGQK